MTAADHHADAGIDAGTAAPVTVRVPAKVNVQLAVGGRRADGFHALATVFFAVGLFDEVTARPGEPGEGVTITVEGPDAGVVPTDGTNLAARAAQALATHHGVAADVRLHIAKDIPVAGGMAGGSADGAAALLACDALWGLDTPRETLFALAAELGSDVPFSLHGGVALGEGRGEQLTPVPTQGAFHWVFAVADGGLSTPAVYGECDRLRELAGGPGGADESHVPTPAADRALLDALATGDPAALGAALSNDLQAAALSLRPSLADTLRAGTDAGAIGALVSGSGPTCAFLTKDASDAAAVASALAASGTCRNVRTAVGPVPGAQLS
ncbi:4-(cytidine 5'-diphospho)-2-C-methyl-D-erythritol kinase [Streptacidiphilus fuscans]|uniref:4-diphosphocytidyl-2-C-methyl-D-erythritol kinase n=1 Tax=Streptacidiphilus fuscans TaxID=2789292 RepID=A0A931B9Y4_9ACTN|nr:4-(cytidine 5'-diphospho)-2-C-methyl-D-erythritol kinase [Streptacidiphilus fuscans]MBF9071645.1 4-(cytidine 5'-diphospho)-2-C-methyl-D-erythritol kinase [Streptacidiphilus fuscans]MBF9072868.1 4-(cytidine 5'-diphospho)-2-C-methyl-D-erythritol kinase [Streptacidiphilus fuscans]